VRADQTAFTAAIAKAALYPTLAVTEELQQQVHSTASAGSRVNDDGSRSG
jgi:hypothetical protein